MKTFVKDDRKMEYLGTLVAVDDVNKSRNFYEKIMEQIVVDDKGDYVVYNGGFSIILKTEWKKLIGDKDINNYGNNFELYFEHNSIEQFSKKINENKIKILHELRKEPWGQKVIRIYDPDNNIIEIGEPMGKK
jgi:catechol 2,3-dioxygenase-like lactoylglutathione lyase family enzyme